MNKLKEIIKTADFWIAFIQRIVSLLLVVIPSIIFIVNSIDRRIDEKLEPINGYIITQNIFEVNKQYQKIKQDPDDVKDIDISQVIKQYDGMKNNYKSPLSDEKMKVIRQYALTNNIK